MGVTLPGLEGACAEWEELLGPDGVVRDPAALAAAARTTQGSAAAPGAVLRPRRREEVADLLRTAGRHGVAVYPVSCARNWGFTDGCPPADGQVQLDLSGLDRVVAVDEALGVAVVEPGVTQGMLADELRRRGSAWMLDVTGAGPDTSVVGNVLDRGHGSGALADRCGAVSGLEVVLADGRVVRTGFGAFRGSRVDHLLRWGLGPSLDGLFSQSNLGVVTEMGIHLAPRPAALRVLLMLAPDRHLEALVDVLGRLRRTGGLPGVVNPFALPCPDGPVWFGFTGVPGSPRVVEALTADADEALGDLCRRAWRGPDDLADPRGRDAVRAALALPPLPFVGEVLAMVGRVFAGDPAPFSPDGLLAFMGGPDVQRLPAPPRSSDPLEEGYGMTFLWPACPLRGAEVRRLLGVLVPRMAAAGFPPMVNVKMVTGRVAVVVTRLVFSRTDEGRRRAAAAAHRDLVGALVDAGYPPARMGAADLDLVHDAGVPAWDLVRDLKGLLDPAGVIAPGRYVPLA